MFLHFVTIIDHPYSKFGCFGLIMQRDRHTHRQTDMAERLSPVTVVNVYGMQSSSHKATHQLQSEMVNILSYMAFMETKLHQEICSKMVI